MKIVGRVMLAALTAASAVAPALALDYEAKPVGAVIAAPYHIIGGLIGAASCGLVSGPIDGGYHGMLKGDTEFAGKLGDEKGWGQRTAAAPVGGGGGIIVGGGYGALHGIKHGWKVGWDKPFSRWSFLTMEEK